MAGSKEIRTKIKSVENTRKITKAMEMVAASKMRKAQDRMRAARPYAEKIRNVAAHMSFAEPEYKHPFLIKRDSVKSVGVIVVTSDKGMLDAYVAGEIDQLYVVYNKFINAMKQETKLEQLLPLSGENLGAPKGHWDYIYEPEAQVVIDDLMVRYIESVIYQAVAENMASEQSARMVAMKAASDNAKTVIGELKLVYNKARQAAITKEISEIVGGAAAVSG